MRIELYEEVMKQIKNEGFEIADYGRRGDVPHQIWSTWKYLPDTSGERLLTQGFKKEAYGKSFKDQLMQSGVYDFYPFITNYDEHISICLGKEGFLKYSESAERFIVALYPDGYDEVTRNCFSWGKLFDDKAPDTERAKLVATMVIWYSYCEVCDKFSYAMDGIKNHTKDAYTVLRDYVSAVMNINMFTYEEFQSYGFMLTEQANTRYHINMCSSKLYNIVDSEGKPVVRFCYDKEKIVMEWKDGRSRLSTHVCLSVPSLSNKELQWVTKRGRRDEGIVIMLCMCGLMSFYRIRLNWHEALSWAHAWRLERLNVRDVDIQSLEDVIQ